MTAEIAILNRSAIALAADSAVTIGSERVWKSSNKLFHLYPHDIAIMVYGSDQHVGMPWETVIKTFRRTVRSSEFRTVEEASICFLRYLDQLNPPDPKEKEMNCDSLIVGVLNVISKEVEQESSVKEKRAVFKKRCQEYKNGDMQGKIINPEFYYEEFLSSFKEKILSLAEDICSIHLTKEMKQLLLETIFDVLQGPNRSEIRTGVVVTGFGVDEVFPVLHEFSVDGFLGGKCRVWQERAESLNKPNAGPIIVPFAQTDVAHSFIEGVNADYLEILLSVLEKSMIDVAMRVIDTYLKDDDKLVARELEARKIMASLEKFESEFNQFKYKRYVEPILKVVRALPKEEMAVLAEALVETTGLRRRMDSVIETVGGPVDVAVLSKADGFVWIKRKHYFDKGLNYAFFDRRKRSVGEESDGS